MNRKMPASLNSLQVHVALLAPVLLVQTGSGSCPNAARDGYRLSLSVLCAKQELQPRQIFVGAVDFDGDGKKSVVAVTAYGGVQVWSWHGDRFVTVYGPGHLPQWKEPEADESVFAADVDGDGQDEILRASDNELDREQVIRIYKWQNGRFRLKHEGKIIVGEDLQQIVAVVNVPKTGQRWVVLLTHNREDAGQTLRFYRLDLILKGVSPLEGVALDTGLFSLEYLGSATPDLDDDGTEELLVSLEGQTGDFSRQPAPKASRLQAYSYSTTAKTFVLQQEWRNAPTALNRLFGGIKRGHEVLLAGMQAEQLMLSRWDGKTFTTQGTGKRIRGEPRSFSNLGENGRHRVIALERSSAVWVSDPLDWESR